MDLKMSRLKAKFMSSLFSLESLLDTWSTYIYTLLFGGKVGSEE